MRDALGERHFRIFSFFGESGIGKTDLLGEFADRARVDGRPVALVDLDRPDVDSLSVLTQVAVGLHAPPMRFRGFRFEILVAALGQGVSAEGPASVTDGVVGLAGGVMEQGMLLRSIDNVLRAAGSVLSARREARVEEWFVDRLGPHWKESLGEPSRHLVDLAAGALAADVADAVDRDPVLLLLDGLPLETALEESVCGFLEQLAGQDTPVVVAATSLGPVRWGQRRSGLSWRSDVTSPFGRVVTRRPLGELERSEGKQLLEDFGVTGELAAGVLDEIGCSPGGLVVAAGLIDAVGSEKVGRPVLLRVREEAGADRLRRLAQKLPDAERRFLEAISLANWFTQALSYELYPVGHDRLFRSLVDKRVIRPFHVPGVEDEAYRLHPLLREALRADAWRHGPEEENRRARLMDWLKRATGDPHTAPYALVYERVCLQAEEIDPDIEFALAVMDREVDRHRLEHARNMGSLLLDASLADRDRIELLLRLGRVELAAVEYGSARELFIAARDRVDPDRRDPQAFSTLKHLAECERLTGNTDRARELFEHLAHRAETIEAAPDELAGLDEAIPLVAEVRAAWGLALTFTQGDDLPAARAQTRRVADGVESLSACAVAPAAARAIGLAGWERFPAHFLRHRARLHRLSGDYVRAEQDACGALEIYGKTSRLACAYTDVIRAALRRDEGDYREAEKLATSAADHFRGLQEVRGRAMVLPVRIDGALASGDWDAAAQLCALLESSDSEYPFAPLYAALGLAGLAMRLEEPDRAIDRYRPVAGECRRLGTRIEGVVAGIGTADALMALGKEEEARESAAGALAAATECDYVAPVVWARCCAARLDVPPGRKHHLDIARAGCQRIRTRGDRPVPELTMLDGVAEGSSVPLRAP